MFPFKDRIPQTYQERVFHFHLVLDPEDEATRAAYSDWCEEYGSLDKAHWLRTEDALTHYRKLATWLMNEAHEDTRAYLMEQLGLTVKDITSVILGIPGVGDGKEDSDGRDGMD